MKVVDLPIIGRKFTWRRGKSCIKLDRVMVEPQWNDTFPELMLWGMKCAKSNQIPLLLESN